MKLLHLGLCVQPPPINGLQKAFINNSNEYKEIATSTPNFNQAVIEITKAWFPDLVFMQIQCTGIIHLNTVKHLKELGCTIINWNGDVRNETPEWMVELAPYVISSFTNMRDVKFIRGLGFKSEWVEIGYDPEIYCTEGEVNTSVRPIVYFGNNTHSFPMSGFRAEMCDYLRKVYGNQFGEYGNGSKAVGNFNGSQWEEAKAYRNAKIAINVSHYEIEKYTSDRMYRILGVGKPVCLAKWYPGIDDEFCNMEHLRTWFDLPELKNLIDDYLINDRHKHIPVKGNWYAKNNFTFDHMVKQLIKLI